MNPPKSAPSPLFRHSYPYLPSPTISPSTVHHSKIWPIFFDEKAGNRDRRPFEPVSIPVGTRKPGCRGLQPGVVSLSIAALVIPAAFASLAVNVHNKTAKQKDVNFLEIVAIFRQCNSCEILALRLLDMSMLSR
ncbi:uncharacterized protein LOC131174001 [Hevea brasiliensis]|uniref:uncharacterized protein LOC131174001 n=1 Tax=Hevea brasiliensis TaxID=3981 RepID=UPI0025ED1158|nr:uncharacterized protein LOC131174001 [Hevea brasiliensis]